MSDASPCLSSLVKILDNILVNSGHKTTLKLPKMTVSAGLKTFENLKLNNYRSNITKTCPVCVPL